MPEMNVSNLRLNTQQDHGWFPGCEIILTIEAHDQTTAEIFGTGELTSWMGQRNL